MYLGLGPLDEAALRSLAQLTRASEFLFIDAPAIFPLAARRRELDLFASTTSWLATAGNRYAEVFLRRYPSLGSGLCTLCGPMIGLAELAGAHVARGDRALEFCLRFRRLE